MVIYAKDRLPAGARLRNNPALRLAPVFSAAVVMMLGAVMTLSSLGWIRPVSFLS